MRGERELNKYIKEIELPENMGGKWIEGMNRAKREESGTKIKKVLKVSSVAAIFFVCVMFIGIKTSPTFADGVSKLFFGGKRLNSYEDDKDIIKCQNEGVGVIIDENLILEENEDREKLLYVDGKIDLRITEAYADSKNIFFFYEIEGDKEMFLLHGFSAGVGVRDIKYIDGESIQVIAANGRRIGMIEKGDKVIVQEYYQITRAEDIDLSKGIQVGIKLYRHSKATAESEVFSESEFVLPEIELKEDKYEINREISIGEEKIQLKSVTVSPMRAALEMRYRKDSSFKILQAKSVTLKDNDGNLWVNILNESNYGYEQDDEYIYMRISMESPYYDSPKELYLKNITLEVMDRDKMKFEIDFKNKKVQSPYDKKIQILSYEEEGDKVKVKMKTPVPESDKAFAFGMLNPYYKKNTNKEDIKFLDISISSQWGSYDDYAIKTMGFSKKFLRDKNKFEIYKGAGEIVEFDLNYRIK